MFAFEGRIFRVVNAAGVDDLTAFLNSPSAQAAVRAGTVVRSDLLSGEILERPSIRAFFEHSSGRLLLEHERIAFPSFPYEWPPEMLYAAGELTLDLAQSLLAGGLGIKDGTPYNILFRGPDPVFIDVLSFERRQPGDPTWLPYAQFIRTFLLPLLANKHFGLGLDQILTTRRDGLEPEEIYRWSRPLQRLKPPFLSLVSMPTWLGGKHDQDDQSIYRKKTLDDPEKARFILNVLFNGLRRSLRKVAPRASQISAWTDYMASNNNYSADHFAAKQRFVTEALAEFAPRRVLDVGCNTGHFSALAAKSGAAVVAIDYDPVVAGSVWRNARAEKLNILPLVVNLTRPTPSTGWRNREWPSFLDRARGAFDGVLMLAVIHHMLVTERVPLAEIMEVAAELTTKILIVEFISPEDSMFRRLTRGRDELHKDLTVGLFEECCRRHFDIVRVQHVENSTRWLYLLKKR
ncbi:MAG: class I SAM-dependent methyltransferase [Bryobacteraceae bacterium]